MIVNRMGFPFYFMETKVQAIYSKKCDWYDFSAGFPD